MLASIETNVAIYDHLFADFSLPEVPGASMMVIKDGQVVISRSYGLANLETGLSCAATTNYRLASVTKQFTAMSILILAQRGKLALEDPLTKFFPDFPAYGKNITVQHLLTHTSGLLAYEDLIPTGATVQVKDKDVVELLRKTDKTMFSPGTQFHYSNTGYAFLAMIVQGAAGQPFAEFLRENIFWPIGMDDSVAFEAGVSKVGHRALGYSAADSADKKRRVFSQTDQSVTSAVLGDGGIYSSINDLFKWDQALYTEKLVRREFLQKAFTAWSKTSDDKASGYGFGWYVGNYRNVPSVWHYGATSGFSTHIERYPDKKLTLIVLANRRNAPLAEISRGVMDLCWD